MSSQQSYSSSEGLSLSNISPRAPSVTVAYPGKRSSKETDSIFDEIDSFPDRGLASLTPFLKQGEVLTLLSLLRAARRRDPS